MSGIYKLQFSALNTVLAKEAKIFKTLTLIKQATACLKIDVWRLHENKNL